jgi:peptidoglycan/xylan/chitin deacetylase (PgdA/CDA1 family)
VFRASRPSLLLDIFRVPYEVAEVDVAPGHAAIRPERGGPGMIWPVGDGGDLRPFTFEGLLLHASAAPEGRPVLEARRELDGSLLLPFDPDEVILGCWSEAYAARAASTAAGSAKRLAMRVYYRVRPLLPRRLQIAMRQAFARVQARAEYPRWPLETGLHDLYDRLLRELATLAGEPVATLAPWPDGRRWALVLTHDVERAAGYAALDVLGDVELETGYRSAWNLVPERDYEVDDERVAALKAQGHEVGVHGLTHDGRDLAAGTFEERLPRMREWAARWGADGFRSPATHRDWERMRRLGFAYDSSSPDTDPFEPQGGGCCTWFPFFNGDVVELPITLTMDHTAFVILRRDESIWIDKAEGLRERGGMALLITHPDYMLDEARVTAYRQFLERYATDGDVWRALPAEVAAWWRRRHASAIRRSAGGWEISGPAAGAARIALFPPAAGSPAP